MFIISFYIVIATLLLVKYKPVLTQVSGCGDASLTRYALSGFLGSIEECAGDFSRWSDATKREMLIAAACEYRVDVVRWLLERGAVVTPDRQDLQCAAGFGYTPLVELLASNGNPDSQELCQPLLMAAANGYIAAVEVLMKYGAYPKCVVYCYTPIAWAMPHLYDGVYGHLPTCAEFVNMVAEDLANEKEKQDREIAELRSHYPGMGLLEDTAAPDPPVHDPPIHKITWNIPDDE
jgi:hypothetical protein